MFLMKCLNNRRIRTLGKMFRLQLKKMARLLDFRSRVAPKIVSVPEINRNRKKNFSPFRKSFQTKWPLEVLNKLWTACNRKYTINNNHRVKFKSSNSLINFLKSFISATAIIIIWLSVENPKKVKRNFFFSIRLTMLPIYKKYVSVNTKVYIFINSDDFHD